MKKYERLLIWSFVLGSLTLMGYFGLRLVRLESESRRLEMPPPAPVAQVIKIDFSGADGLEGWNRHSFNGQTQYEVQTESDGTKILQAKSQGASSALFKPVNVPVLEKPVLSWQWKVKKFPDKKNEVFGAKNESDFAVRVSVIFKSDLPLQQDILQYIWDAHFPEETEGTSPSWKKIKMLVAQSGPLQNPEEWVSEKRDIVKDYTLLFGKPPEKDIQAIGIMSDSDDTKSGTEAYLRNIQIETLHVEDEFEKQSREKKSSNPLAPILKKTKSWMESLFEIPTKTIPKAVVSTTEKIPKAVVSTTKKVIEPITHLDDSK